MAVIHAITASGVGVDEPTVGLDVEARRGFWAVLGQLAADGHAIVLTTH